MSMLHRGCGKGNIIRGLEGGGPWLFSIDPPLPPGLELDPSNGCIAGAPLQRHSVEPVVHTVVAENKVGKTTCQVTIEVVTSPSPPGLPVYEQPAHSGPSKHRGGKRSDPWVVSVGAFACNRCEISGSRPFVVNIRPALPEGLELDAHTGTISGWAMEASFGSYAISVSNDAGECLTHLDIEVQIPPRALVYWAPPQRGRTEPYNGTGPMPKIILATNWGIPGMTLHTRMLQPNLRHRWQQRRSRREVRQLLWHYLSRPLYHYISRNHPLAGTSTRYSVSPALPEGLELDPLTGHISGCPSRIAEEHLYTITGRNAAGMASTDLLIEVLDAPSAPKYKGKQIEMPNIKPILPNMPSEMSASTCTRIGYLRGEDIKIEAPEMYGTQPFLFNILPQVRICAAFLIRSATTNTHREYVDALSTTPRLALESLPCLRTRLALTKRNANLYPAGGVCVTRRAQMCIFDPFA